ncbi:MAG: hypothetical protein ACRC33_13895 [Gemmataceae bacterium]
MTWVILWVPEARSQLAAIWNTATDRQAVTDSDLRIHAELGQDPDAKGIPFKRNRRLYYDDPLAVMYSAYPGDEIVIVHAVKRIT